MRQRRIDIFALAGGVICACAWFWVFMVLRAWPLLMVPGLFFVPVMAWRWARAERWSQACGLAMGWTASWAAAVVHVVNRPWMIARLRIDFWPERLEPNTYHVAWAASAETLPRLQLVGAAQGVSLPDVLARSGNGLWLWLGIEAGWILMALAAISVVLAWIGLGIWLARSPVGVKLRNRAKTT